MSTSRTWTGKTALVTGASSGIGLAVAERLASEGLRVAVCARRKDRLESLRDDLAARGADVLCFAVDLRDEASIGAMFSDIRARWGGVDLLINNAGGGRSNPLTSGQTELWRQMLEVNVLALAICTREAIRDMRERGDDGHVVHVSSMSAHRVPSGSGMYSASKHAVKALTEALRQELRELGSAIRVSSISPGYVETEFAQNFHSDPQAAESAYKQYPVIQPEEIAEWVAHIITAPAHLQVHDVLLRPTHQSS